MKSKTSKNVGKVNIKSNDRRFKSVLDPKHTPSDLTAIFIAKMFGSMKFLWACLTFFAIWFTWNLGLVPWLTPFDKYPFPALEMVVSIFAIVLSISVLISQNRQGRLEKIRQQVEFEVNVHAESEITKVLEMLHDIQKKIGINNKDNELEAMKESLNIQELHETLDNRID